MTGAAAARTAAKIAGIEKLSRERSGYGEILSVFREIFGFVSGKEEATGIAFAVPAAGRAERAAGGLPLIAPDAVRVDAQEAYVETFDRQAAFDHLTTRREPVVVAATTPVQTEPAAPPQENR